MNGDSGHKTTYGHLRQISPEYAGDVMSRELLFGPVEIFAILHKGKTGKGQPQRRAHGMQGHEHTLGGVSKSVWSSFMRLFDPLTRNVPWISVAGDGRMSLAVVQRGARAGMAGTYRFP